MALGIPLSPHSRISGGLLCPPDNSVDAGDLKSSPHACVASALPTKSCVSSAL